MKTKINDFLGENDDVVAQLLEYPFIIKDEITKELKVVAAGDFKYPSSLINISSRKFTTLNYKNLVRYLLYGWLIRNATVNKSFSKIDRIFKTNQFKRTDEEKKYIRPFTQIPTNTTLLAKDFKKYGFKRTDDTNTSSLLSLLQNIPTIFTEENIIIWYKNINGLTIKAEISEERTIDIIKKLKLFKSVRKANDREDMTNDTDIVAYDFKGNQVNIQVKEPSKNTKIWQGWSKTETWSKSMNNEYVDVPRYTIRIENTKLDGLDNYYKKDNINTLKWKFLFLWNDDKLLQINSHSIFSIKKFDDDNIKISLNLDEEWLPKMIKEYNTKEIL